VLDGGTIVFVLQWINLGASIYVYETRAKCRKDSFVNWTEHHRVERRCREGGRTELDLGLCRGSRCK
jgi:hypothetical protein